MEQDKFEIAPSRNFGEPRIPCILVFYSTSAANEATLYFVVDPKAFHNNAVFDTIVRNGCHVVKERYGPDNDPLHLWIFHFLHKGDTRTRCLATSRHFGVYPPFDTDCYDIHQLIVIHDDNK